MLAPAVFRRGSCVGNGKRLRGKAEFSFFLFRIRDGGVGSTLLSQDKVTLTQGTPLLSILETGLQGLKPCLPPSVMVGTIVWERKQGVFFGGGTGLQNTQTRGYLSANLLIICLNWS